MSKEDSLESRISSLERDMKGRSNSIEKDMFDLEIKNMGNELKLYFQDTLNKATSELEGKIDVKIKSAINNQKEKISWGLEILRLAIVSILFILSIKMVEP